jgi:hypothetical protein
MVRNGSLPESNELMKAFFDYHPEFQTAVRRRLSLTMGSGQK